MAKGYPEKATSMALLPEGVFVSAVPEVSFFNSMRFTSPLSRMAARACPFSWKRVLTVLK